MNSRHVRSSASVVGCLSAVVSLPPRFADRKSRLASAAGGVQAQAVIRQNSTRVPAQANRTNNSSVDPAIALRRIEEEGRSDSGQHYTASHRHSVRKLWQIRSGQTSGNPESRGAFVTMMKSTHSGPD